MLPKTSRAIHISILYDIENKMLTIKFGVFSLFVSSAVSVPSIVILSTIDCPSDTTNCRTRPIFAKRYCIFQNEDLYLLWQQSCRAKYILPVLLLLYCIYCCSFSDTKHILNLSTIGRPVTYGDYVRIRCYYLPAQSVVAAPSVSTIGNNILLSQAKSFHSLCTSRISLPPCILATTHWRWLVVGRLRRMRIIGQLAYAWKSAVHVLFMNVSPRFCHLQSSDWALAAVFLVAT